MKIQEINDLFKEIFTDIKVKSVKNVYEKTDTSDYKLIISIHNIVSNTIIAHTKFIFLVDENRINTVNNNFMYLYNMNCEYRTMEYKKDSYTDLKDKISKIITTNDFGKDFKNLNRFITDTPITNINNGLANNEITAVSVYSFQYNPKFKITACDEATYDFLISLSNGFEITLVLNKNTSDMFILTYKFLDTIKIFEFEDIGNMTKKVSNTLSELLKSIL